MLFGQWSGSAFACTGLSVTSVADQYTF